MILHPAVIALELAGLIVLLLTGLASVYGAGIIRHWEPGSGSELQILLEQRTYLVSTLVLCAFATDIGSLFLFVHTADSLKNLFTGAMCAAGTLNVNPFGYPTLLFKLINTVAAGLWLILNALDNRGHDYPLVRVKCLLLLGLMPLIFLEAALQTLFFLGLKTNVITSCCGSLFSEGGNSGFRDLTTIPLLQAQIIFYTWMAGMLTAGVCAAVRKRGYIIMAAMAVVSVVIGIGAIISFLSLYIYELPTHHCPFCILQKEYSYIGYPLFALILGGGIAGGGSGIAAVASGVPSLRHVSATAACNLALVSVCFFLLLVIAALVITAGSNLSFY